MRKLHILFGLFALCCSSVFAQVTYSGGLSPYKYIDGANGQRVMVPQNDMRAVNGQQIWNQATQNTNSGQVEVGRTVALPSSGGGSVPATVRGRLGGAAVGAAAGRVAAATFKAIGPIGIGLAIYDLATEIGFALSRDSSGAVVIGKPPPQTSGAYPEFVFTGFNGNIQACQNTYGTTCAVLSYDVTSIQRCNGGFGPGKCVELRATGKADSGPGAYIYQANMFGGESVVVPPSVPSNQQELTDAIAAKSGWPVGSAISRVIAQDAQPDLQVPEGITVSGPSSSPGPVSTTNDNTNNTTSRSSTTYNYNYAGDTITTTINTVNTTTNNSTGAVTSSSSASSTPPPVSGSPSEPTYSATDSPLGAVPKLYEPVYPRGIAGVWIDKKAELTNAPLTSLASSLMPSVGAGGSCPVMNVNLTFSTWANFGTRDMAPPCYVWDWAKAIVILCSLLLARALIFGG